MLYMFLENGFEETEALATLDVIRRGSIDILTVSDYDVVTGAHNIKVIPDIKFSDISYDKIEGIILPGGQPGSDNLYNNVKVKEIITYCAQKELLICAICAAPYILGKMGLLKGKRATSYPDYNSELLGAEVVDEKVVTDGNVITSKGMGAAILFGYSIVKYVKDERVAEEILESIFAK